MMMKIWMTAVTVVVVAMLGACGGTSPASTPASTDATSTGAPAVDAATLLEARCADCHSLSRVTGARYTQEQWDQVVTQMIQKGAVLNADEKKTLVAYLAETYKP